MKTSLAFYSVTIALFFITKHISNIINNQHFNVFIWIIFFNIFSDIIDIILVFNKSFKIIEMI